MGLLSLAAAGCGGEYTEEEPAMQRHPNGAPGGPLPGLPDFMATCPLTDWNRSSMPMALRMAPPRT